MFLPLNRRDIVRLFLLGACVVALGLNICRLWSAEAWQTPSVFSVDSLETFARLKIMGEEGSPALFGHTIHRLGAPWEADWAAYPMPDGPVFWVFGKISTVFGLIPTGYLMLLFAYASAAGSFYLCCRIMGHRPLVASTLAILFGLSFFNIHRGLSHYSFTLSFCVPFAVLVAWFVGGSRWLLGRWPWRWFCVAVSIVIGTANPYYGFLYVQLLVLALLFQLCSVRSKDNILTGLLSLGSFAAVLLLTNITSILAIAQGLPTLLVRNYAGSEIYGLRPIELLIPHFGHRLQQASEFGQVYASRTMLKGELFSPYLGVVGLAGLLLALALFVVALVRKKAGLKPGHAPFIIWILAFSIVGGIGSLFALSVTDMFRATNRYSVFILAISLFSLSSFLTRRGRKVAPWLVGIGCFLIVLIGLMDQVPRPSSSAGRKAIKDKVSHDRILGKFLDDTLPADTMIFQMPAVPFLEQPRINGMTDYEHFRPFLHSKKMRFSYGLLSNNRDYLWQRSMDRSPVVELVAELEKTGFGALSINKTAYINKGNTFREYFKSLGKAPLFEDSDHLIFRLTPAKQPVFPDLNDPDLYDSWDGKLVTRKGPAVLLGEGWYDIERDGDRFWRWAGRRGTLVLWNPQPVSRVVKVRMNISALGAGAMGIILNRRPVWRSQTLSSSPTLAEFSVTLEPGTNSMVVDYFGRPTRPSLSDSRLLGFNVSELSVTFATNP